MKYLRIRGIQQTQIKISKTEKTGYSKALKIAEMLFIFIDNPFLCNVYSQARNLRNERVINCRLHLRVSSSYYIKDMNQT